MGDEVLLSCISTVEPHVYDLNDPEAGAPDDRSETPAGCVAVPVE
jgi:hypothetical protein